MTLYSIIAQIKQFVTRYEFEKVGRERKNQFTSEEGFFQLFHFVSFILFLFAGIIAQIKQFVTRYEFEKVGRERKNQFTSEEGFFQLFHFVSFILFLFAGIEKFILRNKDSIKASGDLQSVFS